MHVGSLSKLKHFSITPPHMAKRFKEIICDQIEMRDSGSVQCADLFQYILNGRKEYGRNKCLIR